jgi:fumarate hydratase subunit beta
VSKPQGKIIRLTTPLSEADVEGLRAGDAVRIWGSIYTGRDAAHRRLYELLQRGEEPPIPLVGQVIYYVGPSPAPPGRPIGSAGPTTSYRMDPYTPLLIERGIKAMIGKGMRSSEVKEAMRRYKAVYLTATGGAGALISGAIKKAEVVVYEDLGPEAIRRLEVEDFPALVVNDVWGGDLYEEGRRRYERR